MINFLCIFLGFDKEILRSKKIGEREVSSFALLYILILSLSVYACYYAGYLLTDNVIAAALLSLFLTYILHNMYRLIIATSYEGNNLTSKIQIYKYISVKGFLVIILSVFISNSLCISLFEDEIDIELNNYKSNFIADYNKTLNNNYQKEIEDLKKGYEEEKALNLLMNEPINLNNRLVLEENIDRINQKKQSKTDNVYQTITHSNFFIQKLKIISNKPQYLIITIMTIMFFLWPLYIFNKSNYFLLYQLAVSNNHNKLVLSEYNTYKNVYINKLSSASGQEVSIDERYEDPPFNTIPITRDDMILKKGSLLEWIKEYHG